MGISVSLSTDLREIETLLDKLCSGDAAGRVAAQAARTAMDKHMRKDTGQLAGSSVVTAWGVAYPKPYAAIVWDVPPRIVSPRNPLAKANPHEQPDVAAYVADQLQRYADSL